MSMTKKLQQLEHVNRALKSEVWQKSVKVEKLEIENVILKKAAAPDREKIMKEEIEERDRLTKQIVDMKHFLADYGLLWVGRDGKYQPSTEEVKKAK